MAGMTAPAPFGTPTLLMQAARVATLDDALARLAADGPVIVEALLVGVRVQAHLLGGEVTVFGADLAELPELQPQLAAALAGVDATSAVFDGIVSDAGVHLIDCLALDGADLRTRPLVERLDALGEAAPYVLMVERITAEEPAWGESFAEHVRTRGHGGVVVKDPASPYDPASDTWLRVEW